MVGGVERRPVAASPQMSNAALRWAFSLPMTGPKKAVLLALAEHADESGACWPSVARLMLFSGIQERTVRLALRDLEQVGIISVTPSAGRTSRVALDLTAAWDAALNKPRIAKRPSSPRHAMPDTPASHAPDTPAYHAGDGGHAMPDTPASHAGEGASHAPEPSLTPIEPSEDSPTRGTRGDIGLLAEAVRIWNAVCGSQLPVVQKLSEQRKKTLAARLRDEMAGSIENWRSFCEMIAGSTYLTTGSDTWPGATFDWALKPSNMIKILEGNYANRLPRGKARPVAREGGTDWLAQKRAEAKARAHGLQQGDLILEGEVIEMENCT